MLVAFWSPKGGSGTSVLTAACAAVLGRAASPGVQVRVADLEGDQPAIFGLGDEPVAGLADWLAAGASAPTEALDRLAVEVAPGLALLPNGAPPAATLPPPTAEAGAALAVALRDGPGPALVDCGQARTPSSRALVEVADRSVVVVRACYLALRRGVRSPVLERSAGVVLVEEKARSLRAKEVAEVLDLPLLARVQACASVARAVDAGVVVDRLPDAIARPARHVVRRLGLLDYGRAAA